MAQRRSRNRRLSAGRRSGNISGFLNENSNIIDGNDLLWFNRTSVRPSTSLILTRNASTFLNSDSTVDASKVSEKWYENLSKSDSSKLLEAAVEDNIANESHKEQDHSIITESESDQEPQKRRARLNLNRRSINKSEKSNIFLKALEKTTDSHTRNLTRAQVLEGNESESTNDDSKTIQRLRPRIFRNNKEADNDTNKFDDIFNVNSATERILNNVQSPRVSLNRLDNELFSTSEVAEKFTLPQKSILKRQSTNDTEQLSTLVTSQKQQRRSEKTVTTDVLQNEQSKERNITETNNENESFQNKTLTSTSIKTRSSHKQSKASNTSKQRSISEFINNSNNDSAAKNISKKRSTLFSQSRKSKNSSNLFDAVFDSDDTSDKNSKNTLPPENDSEKNLESTEKNDENDDNVSESSSIPKNIRRTRSFSAFALKQFEDEDVDTPDNSEAHKMVENQKSQRQSKSINKSVENSKNKSSVSSGNENSSNIEIEHVSQQEDESLSSFEIFNASKPQMSIEKSDDEDIYDKSVSPSKQSKNDENKEFENQSLKKKSRQDSNLTKNSSINKSMHKKKSKTNQTRNSQSILNKTGNDENEEYSPNSIVSKTRSKLFARKSQVASENIFDKMSYETSKEPEQSNADNIRNTTRTSQRRKSNETSKQSSSVNLSKSNNKSSTQDHIDVENDNEQDEDDADTSTMPTHIRRTMSRLFQKSKAADDPSNASSNQTSDSVTPSQGKKQQVHDKMSRSSSAVLREVNKQASSKLFKTPQAPSKNVSIRESNKSFSENQKENQTSVRKSTRSQKAIANKANVSLNKKSFTVASSENESEQGDANRKSTRQSSPNNRSISNVERAELTERTPVRANKQSQSAVPRTPEEPASDVNSDDLLSTPHPAQSTLNPYGKPLTRITQFSFRRSIIPESPIAADAAASVAVERRRGADAPAAAVKVASNAGVENENVDVDVMNDSDSDGYIPLISRQIQDIPRESEDEVTEKKLPGKAKGPKSIESSGPSASSVDEAAWAAIRQKTDALKLSLEARARRAEREEHERAQQKARIDAKLRRRLVQQEAARRRLKRKPLDKAYQVNGQPYKQPKLPRPKKWVTPRLYEHLRKCLEPEFGLETRLRSEHFVKKLTDIFAVVVKRKKFDNYKAELDDLMETMAELNIIENRYDFWRFCSEFMPAEFKKKAVPMQMPGNVRNIPYEPQLVYRPILKGGRRGRRADDSSGSSDDN